MKKRDYVNCAKLSMVGENLVKSKRERKKIEKEDQMIITIRRKTRRRLEGGSRVVYLQGDWMAKLGQISLKSQVMNPCKKPTHLPI